jgi:hypothetical protein
MYQPYPSAGQPPEPSARPGPPASVVMAVRFMYAGAAVSAIDLIIGLVTVGSLRSNLHKADPSLTPSQLHSAEVFLVGVSVVIGLLGVGLWIWMAMMNKAGRNWARILGTVLFGIDTLFLAYGLARTGAAAGTLVSIVTWLIGLGAVVYLWRRDSTEYFNALRTPR